LLKRNKPVKEKEFLIGIPYNEINNIYRRRRLIIF